MTSSPPGGFSHSAWYNFRRSRQLTQQTERVRLPVRHVALRSGQSYAADGILAEPEDGRTVERAACLHRKGCKYEDRKSTRLNSSHVKISYAVFCLKKKSGIGLGLTH